MQTIFYTEPNFNAGYLNKADGNTYCHCIYRSFRAYRYKDTDKEMSFDDLLKICPLDRTKIESIFAERKHLTNVFEDIYNGKETAKETWEWGYPYQGQWESTEAKALDGDWYKGHTFAEQEKGYNSKLKKV